MIYGISWIFVFLSENKQLNFGDRLVMNFLVFVIIHCVLLSCFLYKFFKAVIITALRKTAFLME